jgi:hypothetical protein
VTRGAGNRWLYLSIQQFGAREDACTGGTGGSCTVVVHGTTARCHNDTCTSCEWVIAVPVPAPAPMLLEADWLLDADGEVA